MDAPSSPQNPPRAPAMDLLLGHDKEWWMEDLSVRDAVNENGEVLPLPEGWWGGPPPNYHGPPTRCPQRGCCGPLRSLVGCGRRRYQANGFDLDLSYVTTKVVAMSFPCSGVSACWRNPRYEVERFLEENVTNNDGCWRIYNVCREKMYQDNGFEKDDVGMYPSPDHCPMALGKMYQVCQDLEEHLRAGENNLAAIHCKAGKGRTGTIICALLVYARAFSALHAVRWYAKYRGGFKSGVTIPSQVRWIAMFEYLCKNGTARLLSNPLTKDWKGKIAYRLIEIAGGAVGPCWNKFIRAQADEESHDPIRLLLQASVSLTDRGQIFTNKKEKVWRRDLDDAVELDEGGFNIKLDPEDAAIWTEPDGLLHLSMSPIEEKRCRRTCRRRKTLDLKAWWCHSFLQRKRENPNLLSLELPRGYMDYMDSCVPDSFCFEAIFEEVPVPVDYYSASSGTTHYFSDLV